MREGETTLVKKHEDGLGLGCAFAGACQRGSLDAFVRNETQVRVSKWVLHEKLQCVVLGVAQHYGLTTLLFLQKVIFHL